MIKTDYLKKLRISFGYSQAKIAKELGLSPQSYNRYELGKRKLNLEVIEKLARFYNVSVMHFLVYRPEKKFKTDWELESEPTWKQTRDPLYMYSLVDIGYQFEELFIEVNETYKIYRNAVKNESKKKKNLKEKYVETPYIRELKHKYIIKKDQLKYLREINNLIIQQKMEHIYQR